MLDFLAALGLVFVIEGLVFAAFPGPAKRAMAIEGCVYRKPKPGHSGDEGRQGLSAI
jgi:hypothetical protein